MDWKCAYCHKIVDLDVGRPTRWERWRRYVADNEFRYLCPHCGAFLYPDELVSDPADPASDEMFFMFAMCPNAGECAQIGVYEPECEKAVLSVKCLLHISQKLDDLSGRLDAVEKALPESMKSSPIPPVGNQPDT